MDSTQQSKRLLRPRFSSSFSSLRGTLLAKLKRQNAARSDTPVDRASTAFQYEYERQLRTASSNQLGASQRATLDLVRRTAHLSIPPVPQRSHLFDHVSHSAPPTTTKLSFDHFGVSEMPRLMVDNLAANPATAGSTVSLDHDDDDEDTGQVLLASRVSVTPASAHFDAMPHSASDLDAQRKLKPILTSRKSMIDIFANSAPASPVIFNPPAKLRHAKSTPRLTQSELDIKLPIDRLPLTRKVVQDQQRQFTSFLSTSDSLSTATCTPSVEQTESQAFLSSSTSSSPSKRKKGMSRSALQMLAKLQEPAYLKLGDQDSHERVQTALGLLEGTVSRDSVSSTSATKSGQLYRSVCDEGTQTDAHMDLPDIQPLQLFQYPPVSINFPSSASVASVEHPYAIPQRDVTALPLDLPVSTAKTSFTSEAEAFRLPPELFQDTQLYLSQLCQTLSQSQLADALEITRSRLELAVQTLRTLHSLYQDVNDTLTNERQARLKAEQDVSFVESVLRRTDI